MSVKTQVKLRQMLIELKKQGDNYNPIYKNKDYGPNMIILSKGKKRKILKKRTLKKRKTHNKRNTFNKRRTLNKRITFNKRKTHNKRRTFNKRR